MRILSQEDNEVLLELLIDDLPSQILRAVAREGGRREVQLVNEMLRWLPRAVGTEEVRIWTSDILDWFVARGDMQKGLGGRYHCVPPYLIGDVGSSSCSELSLCGDPRGEQPLRQVLQPLGIALTYRTVSSGVDTQTEDVINRPAAPIGLERFIALPLGPRTKVVGACESVGTAIIQPKDLGAALPCLAGAMVPAERDLGVPSVRTGLWEVYEANLEIDDRWRPEADWRTSQVSLVRWRPSDDWRGERSARVFYHAGSGRVAEIGPEAASLWQLHLDARAGCPRTIWWDSTRLWVPRMLPTATQQWLQTCSVWSTRFRGRWLVVEMDEVSASMACTTLADTLKLPCQGGRPPRIARRHS